MTTETQPSSSPRIVARAGGRYRATRLLMMLILFGTGLWFCYDGFYNWPHDREFRPNEKPHSDVDILLNKFLGVILPPAGVVLMLRALHKSRGAYRLEDNILYVPGHPPVPLERIESIDKSLWDRKGIAEITYAVPGVPRATLTLDDYVYDQDPTDAIYKQITEMGHLSGLAARPGNFPATPPPPSRVPPRPRIGPR